MVSSLENQAFDTQIIILLCIYNVVMESSYYSFSYFLPVFIIGALAGMKYWDRIEAYEDQIIKNRLFICISVVILVGLNCTAGCFNSCHKYYAFTYLSRILCIFLIGYVMRIDMHKYKITNFAKNGTMYLYCAQGIIYKIIWSIIKNRIKTEWGMYFLWLLLTLTICYSSYRVLDKYFPKILAILTGGRSSSHN
jgi:hypothetical protein